MQDNFKKPFGCLTKEFGNMGRDYYARVAEMLHYMKRFKGGESIVGELVKEFREKYKRRPAMMDELRRL